MKVKCIILATHSSQLAHVLFYVECAAGYSCLDSFIYQSRLEDGDTYPDSDRGR